MNSRKVVKLCENFYDIINFESIEGDEITPKMVAIYKDYIFSRSEEDEKIVESIVNVDKAMKRYIDDYLFRKDLQLFIKNIKIKKDEVVDVIKTIVDSVVDFFVNYHIYTTRVVYISRWI